VTGRALRRGARLGVPAAVVLAALTACLDLGTDPGVPFVIGFDSIPYPSLLAGDTMRDSLGLVKPIRVSAYNSAGDLITGVGTTWFVLDTGAVVDSDGILTTTRRDGSVRIVGAVAGLQSPMRTVRIARRPDTLATTQDSLVEFAYALPDVATNATPSLTVRLQTTDTIGGYAPGVQGWIVRWRAVHDGDSLAATDTTMVTLLAGTQRRLVDTTSTDGTSSRTLRIWANTLPAGVDSFFVVVEARRHGVQVPGSPVVFQVKVAPNVP
jgi:hypothetical protein